MTARRPEPQIEATLWLACELLAGLDGLARAVGPAGDFVRGLEARRLQVALHGLLKAHPLARTPRPSRRARPGRTDPA